MWSHESVVPRRNNDNNNVVMEYLIENVDYRVVAAVGPTSY